METSRKIIYLDTETGEITENHTYAVKEFYNKGHNVDLLDAETKEKLTHWFH